MHGTRYLLTLTNVWNAGTWIYARANAHKEQGPDQHWNELFEYSRIIEYRWTERIFSVVRLAAAALNRPFAQLLPGFETGHPVTVGQSRAPAYDFSVSDEQKAVFLSPFRTVLSAIHMQVTNRLSPDAPSLTQAIIVQMVYSFSVICTETLRQRHTLPRARWPLVATDEMTRIDQHNLAARFACLRLSFWKQHCFYVFDWSKKGATTHDDRWHLGLDELWSSFRERHCIAWFLLQPPTANFGTAWSWILPIFFTMQAWLFQR